MTEKYQFHELDRETRDYLLLARDQRGNGLPGVFVGKTNLLAAVGLVVGFGVIIATVVMTFPPTDPPAKEAMLQTAGFLLGGWMVVAALRVWAAGRSGRYAGHFVYADPDFLYEADGSTVAVTDLAELREAKAVQNFNEGKYRNTAITVKCGPERSQVTVPDEAGGRRVTVFLNAVAYMRDGGEDGKDDTLRKLSPEAMGAVAKHVATTGEFPTNPARAEGGNAIRVPHPRREGRASSGVLGLALIALIGTGLFFGFLTMNYPYRDEAVFARVRELPPKEQPPALRLYLSHDQFAAHRDEARQLLGERYEAGVKANVAGNDADLRRGLADVVLALKDKPTAALSLRTLEEAAPRGMEGGGALRQKVAGEKLADKWGSTIGDELVVFAMLDDPGLPANIDLRWKVTDGGGVAYTIAFRRSPDDEPVVTAIGTVAAGPDPGRTVDSMCDQILAQSVGLTRIRPTPPPEDF